MEENLAKQQDLPVDDEGLIDVHIPGKLIFDSGRKLIYLTEDGGLVGVSCGGWDNICGDHGNQVESLGYYEAHEFIYPFKPDDEEKEMASSNELFDWCRLWEILDEAIRQM